MLPVLQIGSFTVRTPGLALLAALWIGLEVASREGVRRGLNEDRIYNLGFLTVLAGVLGARFGYVLLNLDVYRGIRPLTRLATSVLALAPGTEIVWLGSLAGGAVLVFLIWRWRLDPLALADSFAPGLVVFIIGIGLANLFSGNYYGVETDVFWGINLWGAKRHPTQIYLILIGVGTLAASWRLHGLDSLTVRKTNLAREDLSLPRPGLIAQVCLILISLSILLIEPLRADSPVIGPGLRVWEIVALAGLIGGLATFAYRPPDIDREAAGCVPRDAV